MLSDFICNDIPVPANNDPGYIPDLELEPRQNQDLIVNGQGKSLINLCRSLRLRILNGRVIGDLLGQFTSYHYNGNSVVDYAIVSEKLIPDVSYFQVSIPGVYSDHSLIEFSYYGVGNILGDEATKNKISPPPRYIWGTESQTAFQQALASREVIQKIQKFCNSAYTQDDQGVNKCELDLADIIVTAADMSLKKRSIPRNNSKMKRKNVWFNYSCNQMKDHVIYLGKLLQKYPTDPGIRGQYVREKKNYKKAVRNSKREYMDKMLQHLQTLESRNPKDFWNVVKKLRSQKNQNNDISPDEWLDYFKDLYNPAEKINPNNLFDKFVNDRLKEFDTEKRSVQSIDKDISESEIIKHTNLLKKGKAAGLNGVNNEMIKAGLTTL